MLTKKAEQSVHSLDMAHFNPSNASCSKLLLFKGFSAKLVYTIIFNF